MQRVVSGWIGSPKASSSLINSAARETVGGPVKDTTVSLYDNS